ncbi:MAG: hypothetical protein IJ191_02875 [Treponema sp.]|nr:hypothetical protein [Treponema sp.]
MERTELTGIERELVLQYLIDGNVPVTVTPIEKEAPDETKIKPLLSMVFPVALKAEQIEVNRQGIILLKDPPPSVKKFSGQHVKVEFYFNRVGLYFVTELRHTAAGCALIIPAAIQRIQDVTETADYEVTAMLYYSCQDKTDVNSRCIPRPGYPLFIRPVWRSIPIEKQSRAKQLLERFVSDARKEKNAGNGIQLIPICQYLVEDVLEPVEAVQGRVKPFSILFIDHERIVLASLHAAFPLTAGTEYAVKMSFKLSGGPIAVRDVFATCAIGKVYTGTDERFAADCVFTALQEEDRRFLYEKTTRRLFI